MLNNNNLDYAYRGLWSPHVKSLVLALTECDHHDLLVEVYSYTMLHRGYLPMMHLYRYWGPSLTSPLWTCRTPITGPR